MYLFGSDRHIEIFSAGCSVLWILKGEQVVFTKLYLPVDAEHCLSIFFQVDIIFLKKKWNK